MKKIILLLLCCVMVFSMVACSADYADADAREKAALEHIKTHYGEAEILKAKKYNLNTTTQFLMKDKTDGFEYIFSAMDVPMSDLSFEVTDADADDSTIVFGSEFHNAYLLYLLEKKIDTTAMRDICKNYESIGFNVISREVITNPTSISEITTTEVAFIMKSLNEAAVMEAAAEFHKVDTRKHLPRTKIMIYLESNTEEPVAYYDPLFQRVVSYSDKDIQSAISILHDYLASQGFTEASIVEVVGKYSRDNIVPIEGFTWLSDANTQPLNVYIRFKVEDTEYEYYNQLGAYLFASETDEFGVHEGSFLDIIASEEVGSRALYIALYAQMYPHDFQSLHLHIKQYVPATTETEG